MQDKMQTKLKTQKQNKNKIGFFDVPFVKVVVRM